MLPEITEHRFPHDVVVTHAWYDKIGQHWIKIGDKVSDIATYSDVATLQHNGHIYCGVTDYWEGTFPAVFYIEPPIGE